MKRSEKIAGELYREADRMLHRLCSGLQLTSLDPQDRKLPRKQLDHILNKIAAMKKQAEKLDPEVQEKENSEIR